MIKFSHPYHLVKSSPWPFYISIVLLDLFISIIMNTYNIIGTSYILNWSLLLLLISIYYWFNEIFNEGIYEGEHTLIVKSNLTLGFLLFLLSEVLIFASLFFAYFYNALIPNIELGSEYPPIGINILNNWSIPLFNTALLYISGITITIAQSLIYNRNKSKILLFLSITIFLAIIFSFVQYIEYINSSFTIIDSIFGTTFYTLTGFHAIHVMVGTILLIISFIKIYFNHLSNNSHLGLYVGALYWHFVDYVWLILFALLYCWAS